MFPRAIKLRRCALFVSIKCLSRPRRRTSESASGFSEINASGPPSRRKPSRNWVEMTPPARALASRSRTSCEVGSVVYFISDARPPNADSTTLIQCASLNSCHAREFISRCEIDQRSLVSRDLSSSVSRPGSSSDEI